MTPVQVLELRVNAKGMFQLSGGVNIGTPYILWIPADNLWCLHHNGRPQTKHADIALLGELCRQERAERGYIERVLSAAEPPDVASLDPSAREAHASRLRAEQAKARAHADAQAAAAAKAAQRLRYAPAAPALDPTSVDLDDLL